MDCWMYSLQCYNDIVRATVAIYMMFITGLSYYWREVVKGVILILAISIDAARIIATKKKQRTRQ